MAKKGLLFIVSAPSGTGKTTLCKNLLRRVRNLYLPVSVTTTSPRIGEKADRDYRYVNEDFFKAEIKKGNLLEWVKNFGYYYGTPKKDILRAINRGKDVLLRIDVKGAMQIKRRFPESILIFLKPPSMKELIRRLKKRNTDKSEEIDKRLKLAEKELGYISEYKYVVVNDDLNRAVKEFAAIIKNERKRFFKN